MMDSHFRGTLWAILILFTLPLLTCTNCPGSCLCYSNGTVTCVGNNITDIPMQLPVHTYRLELNETSINVIKEQNLANRKLMLHFSLTHSQLHTIHPKAFHVAPQLKSVTLSFNNLSTLSARVFSPLTSLEQLTLDGNQLKTIAPDVFEGLIGLEKLDMSRNSLSSLASDVFDGLTNLTFLHLGRNAIKKFPPTIFHGLTNLHHLIIYYNELEVLVAGIFDELVNLVELQIFHNQITSLPPEVFWSLRNLELLTISSNRIQVIPEKSFYNMPKLKKLTIYKNPLLSLPYQLMGHMPDMTDFYLFTTNLTTVPGNLFANMSGLQRLHLHLNDKLRELPSDLFCCVPKLVYLSLRFNDLHYLHPQLFSSLPTLGTLVLNDNKLQNLPDNIFQGLEQVRAVNLKNNHLKTLPGDIFLSNSVLRTLTLSGNPWNCVCSIRGIANWIRHNEHVVRDRDDVLCHSPWYQLLRNVGSLREEDFNVCYATSTWARYFSTQEPTTPFHIISTSRKTPAVASTTTPPTTTSTNIQLATQQVTIQTNTPTTKPSALHYIQLSTNIQLATQQVTIQTPKPSALHTTSPPTTLQSPTTTLPDKGLLLITEPLLSYSMSPIFYDTMVVEQGPEFVHHNLYKGWVYVWFLPSEAVRSRLLMFSHVLLVATGLFLSLAAMFYLYRLDKIMDELRAEWERPPG